MRLIEALQIANAPQTGAEFHALLGCGFTPLFLETAVKAHLRERLPERTVHVRTGLYGDLAGTLENSRRILDAAFVILEWGDVDPRLAWRTAGRVDKNLVQDARLRLERIGHGLARLAEDTRVILSLPVLS